MCCHWANHPHGEIVIKYHLYSDQLTTQLNQLLRISKRPRELMQASARAVRRDLQRHFRERDKAPNALGGKRTHWWAQVANSTQLGEVTDTQATVVISEPGLQTKIIGGTIYAKAAGALTIPIHPEAHGRRAKTVEMVTGTKLWRFTPRKGGPTFLARGLGDGKIRLLYVLKKSVLIPRDPQAMPDRQKLESSAATAAQDQLTSQVRGLQLT